MLGTHLPGHGQVVAFSVDAVDAVGIVESKVSVSNRLCRIGRFVSIYIVSFFVSIYIDLFIRHDTFNGINIKDLLLQVYRALSALRYASTSPVMCGRVAGPWSHARDKPLVEIAPPARNPEQNQVIVKPSHTV